MILLAFLLAGCASGAEEAEWFKTKEKAIEAGLQESGEGAKLLGTEEYKGDKVVFFHNGGDFGIANLLEEEGEYQFTRVSSMYGFQVNGDLPFTTMGAEFKTASGKQVSVLIGKVLDPAVESLVLTGDGAPREIGLKEDSTLFYAIHEAPFSSLEVVQGVNGGDK